MDLRLGWDLSLRADQVEAEKKFNDEKQHLLILSPMCLQHAKPHEFAELREQGKRHVGFACSLARLQIEQGGRVLFEYPLAASDKPCLWKLRSIDGMRCVRCDQCQFGMTSVDSEGNVGPAWAKRILVKSIPHGWWHRYCVLCDRACEPRDAAKHRGWWDEIDS